MQFNIRSTHNRHEHGHEMCNQKDESALNHCTHPQLSKKQHEKNLKACVATFRSQITMYTN